ncbi:folate-binding protein YgfZ [filamentous cyanobacterium CCT1]|nr:folate-binding protein YgfZ [filamentous cyanobacterium CCT1]PSN76280.1 folate-binding protein YgfZ [filamentous cyanobacterium CCP4]
MQALRELQQTQGAILGQNGIPTSFGNAAAALEAVFTGAALVDRSHWGVIEMTGGDRLRFIHNQTTNTFTQRQPGEGCDTVFVTSTARTVDLATVYVTAESLLILTSPGQDQRLMDWMDRYIFPADQVSLANLTQSTAIFSLLGPESASVLKKLGVDLPSDLPYGQNQAVDLEHVSVRLAVGSGLALPGYTLLVPAEAAASVWQVLTDASAVPAGETLWQQLRVQQGRPAPDHELTEDYNPLEAGLWQAISFDKGCYIGQETIARLNTYQGVKQQLWGFELTVEVATGTPITIQDEKIGVLTSITATAVGFRGLGYVRTKVGGLGLRVSVGEAQGIVVDLPFLSRGYLTVNSAASR